ncbi:glycosyltransferase family 4 protein [Clostridium botulinum]|uniref:Glycosyltransferase n=2 Tax=Clostridium botulinum TaxID=1491 RepID=A0A846I4Y5_CLOBO|nr:glycosyltransferase family 4 protein [Clostridium botulinum]ACQ54960.1 glycosyl transferase, group 1 family [Clostridium botulinum Ba4 str. 657]AJE09684.1 glycosyl transferases group 1 family protein [Clostridium botulinum CDC_1436]APR00430.1 glycosyl transferases group 1 family protein [Clostridium botulinum]AXG92810.1 glycosyltransferase [Clostridium botulinum]MBY6758791.1 glycosyltransferase family 4 protein [Clostridium botulinum]
MKKILNILAQRPDKTGSGMYLQALIKEADKNGYKQAVIASISSKDKEVTFSSKNPITFFPVIFETSDLPFPIVGMSDVMPYESTKYKDLSIDMLKKWRTSFTSIIKKAINEFNPDIIICHHLWILTALVKELYPNKKIIAFCHGTDLRQLQTFKNSDKSISKEVLNYVITNCKNLQTIIVSHKDEKQQVIESYKIDENKIFIAGTGFNPDTFYINENKNNSNKIKIVYAGKLSYSKGVPFLINSVNLVKKYSNNIELYLAGSGAGDETINIINLCKNNSYSFNINVLGSLSQKKLSDLFRECDILVLPSLYEGLPLVLIEAMACGLKIVCTDLPGIKEWMGETINNSGIIRYVPMPRLENIDTIVPEEIPSFEHNLALSIEKQIKNDLVINNKLKKAIGSKSWTKAFSNIEKLF